MTKDAHNRFERYPRLTMAAIWIVILVAAVAGLEWSLTPGNGRHVATASESSPAPRRYLMMREWERDTDHFMTAPKSRFRDSAGDVRDVYKMSTDDNGFIEPAIRHKDADLDIVFLGGSTTECMYVKPENRFPYLTARKLEDALGLKVNGINAARSGNSTMHSLLLLLGKVVPLKPHYAVLMHATNDIAVQKAHGGYWTDHKARRLVLEKGSTIDEGIRAIGNRLVPYSSRALRQAKRTVGSKMRSLFSSARADDNGVRHEEGDDKAAWKRHGEAFESALRSFVATTRAWKIEPVLMTQVLVKQRPKRAVAGDYITPEKLRRAGLDVDRFSDIHDYFNAIIESVAETEEVLLIDLASAHDWRGGRDLYDSLHFTDAGSRKVADIVSQALRRHVARTHQR